MAIYFVGDTHGDVNVYAKLSQIVEPEDTVIHVGDMMGHIGQFLAGWKVFQADFPCRILFILGNHEDYDYAEQWSKTAITIAGRNLYHIPRGMVLEIEGKTVAFLGGAESVDVAYRTRGIDWWPRERISDADAERLLKNAEGKEIDILVTHAPPASVIAANWPPLNKKAWGLSEFWKDVSADRVEAVYRALKPKLTVSGHMHKSVVYKDCRVLDIDEIWQLPDGTESAFAKLQDAAKVASSVVFQ